jgi:hypothetical protein
MMGDPDNMATRWGLRLAAAVILLACCAPGWAQVAEEESGVKQEAGATAAEESVDAAAPLTERQRIVQQRVARLEDRMFQLSQVLRKTDPDKAGQMMQSLSAARGLLIRQRMDQIIEQLDGRKFADALGEQGQVAEDLQLLLKLLLEEPSKLDERRAEIERLEALKKALGEVLEEQKKERQDSAALAEQPPPTLPGSGPN